MTIRVFCAECDHSYRVVESLRGKRVKCPTGHKLQVPSDNETQSPTLETSPRLPGNDVSLVNPVACPKCSRPIRRNDELAWHPVTCPHCANKFLMPGAKLGWLDRELVRMDGFTIALVVLFLPIIPATVTGLIGIISCRHPRARANAKQLASWGSFTLVALVTVIVAVLIVQSSR